MHWHRNKPRHLRAKCPVSSMPASQWQLQQYSGSIESLLAVHHDRLFTKILAALKFKAIQAKKTWVREQQMSTGIREQFMSTLVGRPIVKENLQFDPSKVNYIQKNVDSNISRSWWDILLLLTIVMSIYCRRVITHELLKTAPKTNWRCAHGIKNCES